MDWKSPIEPTFTHLFVRKWMLENAERGRKPQAFDTPFRYSDAGKCARAMAYSALGYEGEPFDAPSTFVTNLGTMIHEVVQAAIADDYPDAQFEVASEVFVASGHSDGIIPETALGTVQYELKTMGGTAYKKSIGFTNRGMKDPQGPRYSAVLQAAINAKANNCDTVVIGHIALEAISRQAARRLGISEAHRFIAEWVIPKSVWEPLADAELARQALVLDDINNGYLPIPIAIDDNGSEVNLDPTNDRYWQCAYCSYADRCLNDGPGTVDAGLLTITSGKDK
jgi:hypothetical protein